MADDIVTRLQEFIDHGIAIGPYHASLAIEEIERLQEENDKLRDISVGWWMFHIGKMTPEDMHWLLRKVDDTAKPPLPGIYKAVHGGNQSVFGIESTHE